MVLNVRSPVLALAPGEVVALDDAAGTKIVAREGTVWVTEEGDYDDHIVAPGGSLVIGRPGRTLVQALAPAWIAFK